jgi:tetratricopeptide (TPR) repeat protein
MCPVPDAPDDIAGVIISGVIGSVAGDIVGGNKVTYGLTAEELLAALEAREVSRTAGKPRLERQTIIKLAQRLKPDDVLDFDQAVRELERAVTVAQEVIERGERGTNHDAFVNVVLARVAELTRSGDFDGGASTIDQGLAELDAEYRRSRVSLLEEAVKVDTLRRDATAVVWRVEALISVDHPTERPAWLPAFHEQYEAFQEDGEAKGVKFSLSVAIELARRMLDTAISDAERGTAANLLGDSLLRLGELEPGSARLEEAVSAYREALKQYTRDRSPLQWAQVQNNLGNALRALGTREVGVRRLEEAVIAYQDALKEFTRERVPLDWAMVQSNLGVSLRALGKREKEPTRLKEAVVAYRNALKESTRDRAPLMWAQTQNNLGNALRELGEREVETPRLKEAVTAFRAALKERRRNRVPLHWARTQNNLGATYARLGEGKEATVWLRKAVLAFRSALKELTRERVPLEWALSHSNLGNALLKLGELESGTARLEEAVAAYREALKEQTSERVPLEWAATQNNLGAALETIGEREAGTARLEEAVAAYDAALSVSAAEPAKFADVCANRDRALALIAQRTT